MKTIISILTLILSVVYADASTFVLCEGNYASSNASLWSLNDGEISEAPGNPVGDTGQSLTVYNDQLFVINNGSSTIEVYDIFEGNLSFITSISTNYSGPREMAIHDGLGYVTEWYTNQIAILNLETFEFIGAIPVDGMPEDIVSDGNYIYSTITMNADWYSSDKVVKINPITNNIEDIFTVGAGPGQIVIHNNVLYTACTYYDASWNGYAGTSSIDLNSGEVTIADYGITYSYGADLTILDGNIYRTYNNGIIQLDDNLEVIEDTHIYGDFSGVYSMASYDGLIYLGITDYVAPDDIIIIDFETEEIVNTYSVGAIPGSFAFWDNNECSNGLMADVNGDYIVNVVDIIEIVNHIIGTDSLDENALCVADINEDGIINVSDIVEIVNLILG